MIKQLRRQLTALFTITTGLILTLVEMCIRDRLNGCLLMVLLRLRKILVSQLQGYLGSGQLLQSQGLFSHPRH